MAVQHPAQIAQNTRHSPHPQPAHRTRAARAFERACELTGVSGAELSRRLGPLLGKRGAVSRQTLADWRRGKRAVPLEAFLAACELAGLRPPMIFALAGEAGDEA